MTARLPFPPVVLEQHGAILGKTGSGKSYLAQGAREAITASEEMFG